MRTTRELKIGTSWVRGIVGDALTPEMVVSFACAFGTWVEGGPVVISRDTRPSSPMLRSAVIAGLVSPGCEVIDLGVCPTPMTAFAVRELGCAGGIAITGSHNDTEWNALKFIGPDGMLLDLVRSEELLDIYHGTAFSTVSRTELRPIVEDRAIKGRYLEHLLSALDADLIRSGAFHLAVDFCNGACLEITQEFLSRLGCRMLPINAEVRTAFAHPPAPSIENMRQLASVMAQEQLSLGIALNVDGDRIGLVTDRGEALSEETGLPLCALQRLRRRAGPVVTNLSTSRMVDGVAGRFGQRVVRTAVGESHVMNLGMEEGAVLAGEGAGGVGVIPTCTTFDALMSLGLILEGMASNKATLSDLVAELPRFAMRKGQVVLSPARAYRAVEGFRSRVSARNPNCTDGVLLESEEGWVHVRVSNTEPLLRVIVEACNSELADRLFEETMAQLEVEEE